MPMDTRLLAQARDQIAKQRQENRREQDDRRAQVARRAPAALEAERELTLLMSQVVGAALRQGGDPIQAVARVEQRSLALQEKQRRILEQAGFPPDWLEDIFTCPRCRDTGYVLGKACDCLMVRYEALREQELRRMLRGHSGDFVDFHLDIYPPEIREYMEQVLVFARSWAENFGPDSQNLLFRGGPGVGKSALAACIVRYLYEKEQAVMLETVGSVIKWYEMQKFSRSQDQEENNQVAAELRRLESCQLLVLDDLGTEMSTSFSNSALFGLLDERQSAGRKTILITALEDDKLAAQYPPQLLSRLRGEFTELHFYGSDRRRKG